MRFDQIIDAREDDVADSSTSALQQQAARAAK